MRAIVIAALVACHYEPPGDGSADAPPAGPCQDVGTTSCAGDTLRTCTTVGELPDERPCSWGCDSSGTARCKVITPSANGVTENDLEPDATLADVTIGAGMLDGNAGMIMGVDPLMFESHVVGKVRVFRFKSLHITGSLKLVGDNAIALVADGAISIDGMVDARGCMASPRNAGPGGHDGGIHDMPNNTTGGGQTGGDLEGSGGGGNGAMGAPGGNVGGAGGALFNADFALLEGGGGGAGGPGGNGGVIADGGGGGGALQLVSNTSISIAGGINAGGCGGGSSGGGGRDAAAGGGAGGTLIFEAPTIEIAGMVAANGGGGGGSDDGSGRGADGTLDKIRAAGGMNGQTGGATGGKGAAGIEGAESGSNATHGSGGGGGIGRIKLANRSGQFAIDPMKLSPAPPDNATASIQTTATVH